MATNERAPHRCRDYRELCDFVTTATKISRWIYKWSLGDMLRCEFAVSRTYE